MPVRKFRSVQEMNQPVWRTPGDPALYEAIARLWTMGAALRPRRWPPGVRRFRGVEELDRATPKWRDTPDPDPGDPGPR